jgi:hypothetical protein
MDHPCIQSEQIEKMNLLLLGNGNPEDGYIFKVIKISSDIEHINNKLTWINAIVKELHDESVGNKSVRSEARRKFESVLKTASFIIAALALCITAYFGYINSKKNDKTIQKVENLGEPLVVNSRGQMVPLPDGFKLKMWPKDYIKKDSVK